MGVFMFKYFAPFLAFSSCGYDPATDTSDSMDAVQQPKYAEPLEPTGPTDLADGWTLKEIDHERLKCTDTYYDQSSKIDQFCSCLIEKISMRWGYESYQRHEFSFIQQLGRTGSIKRCIDAPSDWTGADEAQAIADDQSFDPIVDPILDALKEGKDK